MGRIAAIFGVIAAYVASERFLRQGKAAMNLEEQESDRGTTRAVGRALGISTASLTLALLLNRLRVGVLHKPRFLFTVGFSAMVGGLVLRGWANRVLGGSYTRTLQVVSDQHIIQDGPYRVVRHPGYLGTLLVWLGAAVALANGIVVAIVSIALFRAYWKRVEVEERMLLDTFGDEYRAYTARTKRLIPFVY